MVLVGNKADLSPERYVNLCYLEEKEVKWTGNQSGSHRGSATDSNKSFHLFVSNLKLKEDNTSILKATISYFKPQS